MSSFNNTQVLNHLKSRLLNNLTQALQSAGLDLSQASISVQINLGKRANSGLSCGTSSPKVLAVVFIYRCIFFFRMSKKILLHYQCCRKEYHSLSLVSCTLNIFYEIMGFIWQIFNEVWILYSWITTIKTIQIMTLVSLIHN